MKRVPNINPQVSPARPRCTNTAVHMTWPLGDLETLVFTHQSGLLDASPSPPQPGWPQWGKNGYRFLCCCLGEVMLTHLILVWSRSVKGGQLQHVVDQLLRWRSLHTTSAQTTFKLSKHSLKQPRGHKVPLCSLSLSHFASTALRTPSILSRTQ